MKIQTFATPIFLALAALMSAPQAQASWESSTPAWQQPEDVPVLSHRAAPSRETRNMSPFSPGSHNIAIDLGQVFLMGDLTSKYSDNLGGQLHYTYGVSDIFGFDASLGYSEHSDGKYSVATALAGLRTNLAWFDRVIPYMVFGLGFYHPNYMGGAPGVAGATPNDTLSALLFGIHLGPGVDLQLTKYLFFGAGLTFHNMFATKAQTASGAATTVGGTYTSFLLRAGVTF